MDVLKQSGVLYVVATPIGNLEDISTRAVAILRSVDVIAAEDTRHSKSLLRQYDIDTNMISMHDHNEDTRSQAIIKRLLAGEDVALVSDAGTPLISDPGFILIREARQQGIQVSPVPGPSAVIAALSVSGLPCDRFVFEGFLSAKSAARKSQLSLLLHEPRSIVLYESSHRIESCLLDIQTVFGNDRQLVLARELTKLYETICSGTVNEVLQFVQNDANQQRGEFVLIIGGFIDNEENMMESQLKLEECLKVLMAELPLKQAVSLATKLTGFKRNQVYELALRMTSE